MRTRHHIHPIALHRQSGAALVVSLVLLLVMTLLGVSTMNSAKMEMRMAANTRFYENAFQLAETGIDTTLAGLNADTIVAPPATANNLCGPQGATIVVPQLGGTHQTQMCFLKDALSFATGAGSSASTVRTFFYQANSQGIAQSQASSLHMLGMSKLGPNP